MKNFEIDNAFYTENAKNACVLRYFTEELPRATDALSIAILGCLANRKVSTIVVFAVRNVEAEFFKIKILEMLTKSGMVPDTQEKHSFRLRGKKFIFTGKEDNYQNFKNVKVDVVIEP